MNYYDEIKEDILQKINDSRIEEALVIVQNELNMPYVPFEFQAFLEEQYLNIMHMQKDSQRHNRSDDELLELLNGDSIQQLNAVSELINRNLREYTEQIQTYFDSKIDSRAQSLMIDGLIRQEVNTQFTVTSFDKQITFNARYLEPLEETDGYIVALGYLKEYFENDNPSMFKLSVDILNNECFLALPESFSEDEGYYLSSSIALYIVELFYDDEGIIEFCAKNKIDKKQMMELFSINIDI